MIMKKKFLVTKKFSMYSLKYRKMYFGAVMKYLYFLTCHLSQRSPGTYYVYYDPLLSVTKAWRLAFVTLN